MLCENCGEHEASIRYAENINGKSKEINVCLKCGQKMGLDNLSLSSTFDSLLSNFLNNANTKEVSNYLDNKAIQCNNCGLTYDEFARKTENLVAATAMKHFQSS